ncbi:MAG: maltokinase N-terminal cap-like domain-containing protein [Nocardioides sp.]
MIGELEQFIGAARWFGGKGRTHSVGEVRRAGTLGGPMAADAPTVGIELVTLEYPGTSSDDAVETEVYQVPLAYYLEPQERLEHAYVGTWKDPELGQVHAYDALHDRSATALWLQSFAEGSSGNGLAFHRVPGHDLDLTVHSTLFTGEQSNSSVAFGEDSLMKVFRKVTPGHNPDIEIHEALTEVESDHVAALYGWLEATGHDSEEPLHLAMLQQFLRTASDGWDLALASVRDLFAEADLHADEVGGDFGAESHRLGVATGEVHDALAHSFPTTDWDAEDLHRLADAMRARLDHAIGVVPELVPHADALRETFAAVEQIDRQVLVQRVHGDFHLGQTLRTSRGWKIVDFEGEPAKPLAERIEPDSPWRDVAGMLRSFDYAAPAVEADVETHQEARAQIAYRAAEWAERNQREFLAGYVEVSGRTKDGTISPEQHVLLRAYQADKAVYETVYEARNRPSWIGIPLGAIARLTEPPAQEEQP